MYLLIYKIWAKSHGHYIQNNLKPKKEIVLKEILTQTVAELKELS